MHGHGIIIFAAHACLLAQSGAHPPCEFREIACLQKTAECMCIVLPVNLIIPFRNQIVQRAPRDHSRKLHRGLAERNTAVHASGPLLLLLLEREMFMELIPVFDALLRVLRNRIDPVIFQKSRRLPHLPVLSSYTHIWQAAQTTQAACPLRLPLCHDVCFILVAASFPS